MGQKGQKSQGIKTGAHNIWKCILRQDTAGEIRDKTANSNHPCDLYNIELI